VSFLSKKRFFFEKMKRLLIFGGNGFAGQRICKQALERGWHVDSISRRGNSVDSERDDSISRRGKPVDNERDDSIHYHRGDVFGDVSEWIDYARRADAIVSTIGAFGSNEHMEKQCGDATIRVVDALDSEQVDNDEQMFGFVSAHRFRMPMPEMMLHGYYNGKKRAEQRILQRFGADRSVLLRCPFIYGERADWPLAGPPLHLAGRLLESIGTCTLSRQIARIVPPLDLVLTPSIDVDRVAQLFLDAFEHRSNSLTGIVHIDQMINK
jgi:nucleoside-diphosphate-sugar epimerase